MQIGLGIPTCREGLAYPSGFADLPATARLAQRAARLGFDSLWANDHLATQRVVMDSLPTPPNFYEPIVTFAFLAPQVPRLRFVLATIVAPLREPVLLAKQVATLDQATGGRVTLGLGIGAYREEFEAINRAAGTINRGAMLDETVAALRLLFGRRRAAYAGKYVGFAEIEVFPKPAQNPLPIFLSGNSPDAIRRAAVLADGWILAGASPEQARSSIASLRQSAEAAGRAPDAIQACVQAWVSGGETEREATRRLVESQHFRRLRALKPDEAEETAIRSFAAQNLFGSPEQMLRRIDEYGRAGVDHLGLVFLADRIDQLAAGVELFGERVLPNVRDRRGSVAMASERPGA
ncbi:MAG TPA: TIGR03619 family F420-dependent LLM class oxidoreductase [Thermomicrobiales bacterium]|nr:TIGR03619 family F420-dependent LLM class oxidoreductase [Thermomicrobiales bacterium]